MKNDLFFSVVIPAFNRAHSLKRCIESVLNQTEQRFEIIVVDDGSTDNTKAVIDTIADSRVRYIYKVNGGGSKARNTGIDIAEGQFIAFLDSDDIFLPHHLANALPALVQGDNVCTFTQVIVDRGEELNFIKPHRPIKEHEHISEYLMRDRGFVQTSTLVVPRELALKSKYDEVITFGQDTDFAIKLVFNGGVLRMLSEPGAIWDDKWSANLLSSKSNPQQRLEWLRRIKPMLTDKAYLADTGWPVAKGFAQNGQRTRALNLFFKALVRGCYRPKMAIVIFLQVALSKSVYRKMSDVLAKFGVQP